MRKFLTAIFALTFTHSFAGCSKDNDPIINDQISRNKVKITVGSSVFTASLYDNATANAFKAMMPLTINMSELNGNEKLYGFPNNLPSNASNPGSIQNGDIMLYGPGTLVLFYKSFSTSYSYSRIGKVDDTSGYAAALASGAVTVTFELQ
ncbi:cyclophilin-like fold protein [Pedobacter gandavensis]|uniref:cyclophilin-like fold protein n=1 Tax=Pedobacter gandavensis TaxID=2679963 RepID=UPI00292F1CF8|nr:cyclophilin-like fold protein [Pedobacter gandavensis]